MGVMETLVERNASHLLPAQLVAGRGIGLAMPKRRASTR